MSNLAVADAELAQHTTRRFCDPQKTGHVPCRVAVLTHYLPPYISRVLYYLTQHVNQLDILLSIDQEPNRQFGNTWDGLSVAVQKSLMLRRPWKHDAGFQDELYVHFPYDTLAQLRRRAPDIVFSFELGFRSLVSAIYAKTHRKKLALCVCVSEHTEQGRNAPRRFLRKRLLKMADAVTYNGPSCRRYLEGFDVPAEKLFHFPYACSDLFQYAGKVERGEANSQRLLYVGQLSERKGVEGMLQSLIAYCQSRPTRIVELDIVGSGPLEEPLKALALPSNLHARFLGHLDYEAMAAEMESSGVMIFPTLADEWGLVVNEAMAAGMPVIGSEYAQASTTLIRNGQNGWRYTPGNDDDFAQRLDEMYATSASDMLKMRREAQNTVADITPQNVAANAAQMFAQLTR